MWNYVFFVEYLHWKGESELTGIETYVFERMADNDTSWYFFFIVAFIFNIYLFLFHKY